ncbi:MAG: hypothetical protein P0S96_05765 [Simkaniaceae bacterium]|nr:hypothetical protein [Candidatus Sacchlamyda saccharinae]
MKVSATFSSQRATFTPAKTTPLGISNLSSIHGRGRKGQSPIAFLWGKISSLFSWILSFFIARDKPVEQRFHKVDVNGQTIRYRINGTENEIKLGCRCVRLDELDFPDKGEEDDLAEMLMHIIEQEKIDVIETHNPYHAWLLFGAGLKTKGEIPFRPDRKTPLDTLIHSVLNRPKDRNLARKIEAKFILCILAGAIDMHNALDLNKAGEELCRLERAIGRKIDLKSVHRNVPKSSRGHVTQLMSAPKGMSASAGTSEYAVPIRLLFPLLKKAGKEIKRTMIQRLPLTQFTKG